MLVLSYIVEACPCSIDSNIVLHQLIYEERRIGHQCHPERQRRISLPSARDPSLTLRMTCECSPFSSALVRLLDEYVGVNGPCGRPRGGAGASPAYINLTPVGHTQIHILYQPKPPNTPNSLPPPTPTALAVLPTTPPTAVPSLHGSYVQAAQAKTVRDQNRHPRQYD
jgi:hypothetical protein